MTDLNELKRLVDFYNQYGPQPLVSGPGGDSTSAWNAKLGARNAFAFAQQMMGPQSQGEPDYFALADRYAASGPQSPMSSGPTGYRPMMGQNNYLARMVGGAYGR